MCDHSILEYIGDQECSNGESIPLYNCLKCQSTITLKDPAIIISTKKFGPFTSFKSRYFCSDSEISKSN